MKFRVLIFFLLLIAAFPQFLIADCCCKSRVELAGWWGSGDYLLLWRKKRHYPPLVTTSPIGTPEISAGILGLPTTSILFGDEATGNSPKSGWAFDAGVWLNGCWGLGGGYFNAGKEQIDFSLASNGLGDPIIARPFFDIVGEVQSVLLLSFPGVSTGRVDIDASNNIWGYDFYARYRVLRVKNVQLDALGGMFFSRLDDDLNVESRSTNIEIPMLPETTIVKDRFDASNAHYAGMGGAQLEWRTSWLILQAIGKVAFGNMVKKVEIDGQTMTIDGLGDVTVFEGGLLALPTNIGHHSTSHFEIVSMVNANALLCITSHLFFKVGYTFVYWPSVALAGEQVDLNVNTSQLNGGMLVGVPAPRFDLKEKSFWAHGLRAGFYIVY